MPTIAELRAKIGPAADALTDQDLYEVAKEAYGPYYADQKQLDRELGYNPNQNFTRGLKIAGRGGLAAGAGMVALGADAVGATAVRDSALGYAQRQQQQAFQLGRRTDDFDNAGEDPMAFLAAGAGQAVGFALPSIVTGGVGGAVARGLGARALAGMAAGGGAVNLIQEAGGIYNDLAEQGKYEPGRALLYGAGAAALDTASEMLPFAKGAMKGGLGRRVLKGVTTQAGTEAATEVAQTAIERAGAYKDVGGDEAWHEYRNAAALGAIGGGMFGAVSGLPSKKPPPRAPLVDDQQRDLLAPEWTTTQGFDSRPTPAAPAAPIAGAHETWTSDLGASPGGGLAMPAVDGFHRSVDDPSPLTSVGRRGAAAPLSEMPAVDFTLVGDQAGAAVPGVQADVLHGRDDGDPGLALARDRYLEQQRQRESALATKQAVAEKAAQRQALALRTQEVTGVQGTAAVDLFGELERQKAAGLITDIDFESDAALISTREFGKVRKNIKARDQVVQGAVSGPNAAGNGGPGPADAGRGVGSQQPRGGEPVAVQPDARGAAAPAVGSVEPAGIRPGVAGSANALTEAVEPAAPAPIVGSGNVDAAKAQAARTMGRELKPHEALLVERMAKLSPRDASIVRDALGMDEQGHLSRTPMTMEDIGQKYRTITGKNKGGLMSRQSINAVLKKVNIGADALAAAQAAHVETVNAEELGIGTAGEGEATGMRVTSKAMAGGDDFQLDAATVKAQRATDRTIAAAGKDANASATETLDARKAVFDAEIEAKRQETATVDAMRADARDRAEEDAHAQRVLAELKGLTRAEVEAAAKEFNGNAEFNEAEGRDWTFDDLRPDLKRQFIKLVRAFGAGSIDIQTFDKAQKGITDEQRHTNKQQVDGRGRSGVAGADRQGPAIGDANAAGGSRVRSDGAAPAGTGLVVADRDAGTWGNQLEGSYGVARSASAAPLGGRVLDRAQTRAVDLKQLLTHRPYAEMAKRLRGLGVGHALDWVSEWRVANGEGLSAGWLEADGGRYVLTMDGGLDESSVRWIASHEVGHAVDMTLHGGVYSSHPDLAFSDSLEPTGAVAQEMAELQANDDFWGTVLQYPFDHAAYGLEDRGVVQGELFAQLFAAYASPAGREKLELEAPQAFAFMQGVIEDVKATRPFRTQTPGQAGARARAFAARQASGSSPANQPGVARAAQGVVGAAQRIAALEAQIRDQLPAARKTVWGKITNAISKYGPYLLTSFQIAEQFGDRIKSLAAHVKIAGMMRVESMQQQMAFDEVAKRWNSMSAPVRESLNEVMLRATLQQTHPDLPLSHKDNAHLTDENKAKYAELARKYQALPADAKQIYQDAKAALEQSRERMEAAARQVYDTYGITRPIPDRVPGPYFPLLRFGDYLAIGESKEFQALADQLSTAEGKAREELQKRVDEMKRNPAHYRVSAHEHRTAMDAAVKEYAAAGLDARASMAGQRGLNGLPRDVHKLVHEMAAKMANTFDGATANAVVDAYTEMLMKTLPELSAMHRQAQRVGVEGASADMLRAFAAAGRQNAFYTSRMMFGPQMAENMQAMKEEVKGDIDLMHIHRELEKRAALNVQFFDTPVQDLISRAGHVWYLAASPTYLLQNSMQPWLVTGPVLAGRYGLAAATKALGKASREALLVLKDARYKDGKWSPWEGIHEDSIPGPSVSEDRKALRELIKRGVVDEGLTHDMAQFAAGENGTIAKFARGMGWASQQVELVNRVATALASFRLARADGMTYEQAVDQAFADTVNTQMDYSQENTARVMRQGGGVPAAKLIFQFRRYQQAMLYVIGANIKKLSNPAERKVAAATLSYFTVTAGLAAGVMGLPFIGSALLLANMFRDLDDEDGDAETALRNALFDLMGDKDAANVLAKGVPAMFGADLSKRIGMADLARMYPNADWSGKTGQETVAKVAASIMGPGIGGLGANALDAASYFSNGDYAKGAEKMMPKVMADVIRASRYATQGMTERKGETILGPEEFSAWELLLRGLGTASLQESNYYEGTRAKMNAETAANDRKTRIHNAWIKVQRDDGDMGAVREMIAEFNADHPQHRISGKDEVAWRKALAQSARQRDGTGIKVDPRKDRGYADALRFAR